MLTVGLDVHLSKSRYCILDAHGKVLKEREVIGSYEKLLEHLGRITEPFRLCYEASTGYGPLYERISRLPGASQVQVAHPGQLRLIFKSKGKNDRADARKLASLMFLDQVPQVHVPRQDVRSWRMMINWRQKFIGKRTAARNQFRTLLKNNGIIPLKGTKLWSARGLEWILTQKLPGDSEELCREMLLEDLREIHQKIRKVEGVLNKIAQKHPGVKLLRTIPGIGPRTAEAFMAYVDNPVRFKSSSQAGVYFGLVPMQDASADKNRLGHITREGPAVVRKLLTEASWQAIRKSPAVKARFERITHGMAARRKIGLVAISRWLVL